MHEHWAALLPVPSQSLSNSPIDATSLGIWALQFTPRVTLLEEAVLAEVQASAGLFGGLEPLRQSMEDGAAELGARIAWAPTGLAALALARSAGVDGFSHPLAKVLDALPLSSLTQVARHEATLARVGCRTLGAVRALPRGGLGRRFDKQLLATLDQAYGLRPEAYEWLTLPESFSAKLEFMSRVETAPGLLFGAHRLLVQMASWLCARRLGATAFTLRWFHDVMRPKDAGASGELTIRTAQPMQSVAHFARLLSEHLAKTKLLAPVGDIELVATEVASVVENNRSLLPETASKGASIELALERIQARLGTGCVRRPVLAPDHRLEWMQQWESAQSCPLKGARAASKAGGREPYPLPLPTWVLPEPLRLPEREHVPIYQGRLQMLLGPDRVEGGWWHRSSADVDAQPLNVQRDYWLALSPHAGVLWVFQQRLAGDETAWFLHGHFG
jgi:protein ImuB